MNIFRFVGDMCHLVAILLLLKMAKRGKASGVSLKAQELYLVVYISRYLDLFTTYYSFYNSVMKVYYIFATGLIVKLLRSGENWHTSYSPTHDSFPHWKYLCVPAFLIASVTQFLSSSYYDYDYVMEFMWTYSIFLEAVAMVPQLIMFQSDRTILKGNHQGEHKRDEILLPIFLFGIYRGFYIVNWIYRAHTQRGYRHHYIVYFCGVVQVLLYSSFFRIWCKSNVCPDNDETEMVEPLIQEPPEASSRNDENDDDAVIGTDEKTLDLELQKDNPITQTV